MTSTPAAPGPGKEASICLEHPLRFRRPTFGSIYTRMKATRVTVRFSRGLHARNAAKLVRLFRQFHCRVLLRAGNRVANASSILSILLLAATFNTQLEIQASGEDESGAIRAAQIFFQNDDETAPQPLGTEWPVNARPETGS